MKKLTIVSSVPIIEPVVHNRVTPFFSEFLKSEFIVSFLCPHHEDNTKMIPDDVELHEVMLDVVKPKNFVKRALQEMKDVRHLLKASNLLQADIYLLTMPSIFLPFLAPRYLKGRNVFLDVRDLTWEYLSSANFIHGLSRKIFATWFKLSINFFKGISVTNATELKYVQKIWRGREQPLLVTNGISQEQFDILGGLESNKNKPITMLYIGNIGLAQNLDTLIYAAQNLPNVNFKIVGTGIDFSRLNQLLISMGLTNVEMPGRVPWQEVRQYYNQAHILYAQLAPEYEGAMPSKLYEYLATGKYIIYGGQGQAVEILSEFSNNQVIPPCNVHALVEAIDAFQNKDGHESFCVENREKIKRQYIREDAAKSLVKMIESF